MKSGGRSMKRAFSLLVALAIVFGLLPRVWSSAAASADVEHLCYDDHVDLSGYAVRIVDAGVDQNSGKAVSELLNDIF